jgi:hypothetical protein
MTSNDDDNQTIEEIFAALARCGLIIDSGRKRFSERTGQFETVWVATDYISKWLRPAKQGLH